MAIVHLQPSDPRYASLQTKVHQAFHRLLQECDPKTKRGETKCQKTFDGSEYILVYPAKRIEYLRSQRCPPDADAGKCLGIGVGKTGFDSPRSHQRKYWTLGYYDFSGGRPTMDCTKTDCFFIWNRISLNEHAMREGGNRTDDTIAVPGIFVPANKGLAMIVGDFDNDGLFDFATVAPNGAFNLFLTDPTQEGANDYRTVDIFTCTSPQPAQKPATPAEKPAPSKKKP